jgi:hypothetical protein
MIYDLRRTRGITTILLTIAAVMAVYGLILSAALRPADGLLREQTQDTGASTKVRFRAGLRRILGLVSPDLPQPLQPEERLGLLLGASVLWTGIDPYALGTELDGPHRWANIPSSKHAEDCLFMTKMIYSQGLRPDVLILVTSPGALVTTIDEEEARAWYDPRLLFHHLRRRELGEVAQDVQEISYIPFRTAFPYHAQIYTLYSRGVFKAQLRLFQRSGSGLSALFAPDPDPWREPLEAAPPRTPENDQRILRGIKKLGWFDGAKYRSDSRDFRMLVELFRLAHENRTQTFLMLVPESPAYRAKLPPDNAFHLTHTLRNVLGEAAPVVLDFRASAADEDFRDVNHLNGDGRVRMTERLAKALKPYLR